MVRFTAIVTVLALTAFAGGCQKSDRQLMQGEWTIASVEFPPDMGPREQDREQEELKDLIVVVKRDRITVTHASAKTQVSALFALDASKEPKELDAPEIFVSQNGREEPLPVPGIGIYKFEGDELVIALAIGDGKKLTRPTEFKPSGGTAKQQGVFVIHLKRK
jgi:uncharacterized protein (TIGR03067 family)